MTSEAAGVSLPLFAAMLTVFAVVTVLLGLYGYRHTKNDNAEFLLGRNKTNPLIIGLSYGATFLSASAVIGFGGQAAVHGLTIVWLTFLNIFMGLFVAFIVFGPRTRKIGKKLGASTFADLLGKIYQSKGIRAFTAVLIIVMMPIYCAAVLKGGVNSVAVLTGLTEWYDAILLILAVLVGVYVVYGGIIAVMYNDALQAGIMFVGMIVILVVTFWQLGGVTNGFEQLAALWDTNPETAKGVLPGFNGWTGVADFGSSEWMLVITTFIMGVGLGVLTQPQLVVRFMSAKSEKMLKRAMIVGGIFILPITGTAFTVGPLSNVYFFEKHGMSASQYVADGTDFIIPQYILEVFQNLFAGDFFICLFLLSLVCASISTISALMHTIGTAGGYDIYTLVENRKSKREKDSQSIKVNRSVTAVMLVLVVVYCYVMPNDIIAKATSLFMGIAAAAVLPAYCHGLYCKGRPDKRAAVCSIAAGTGIYLFWALFINASTSVFMPVCKWITGKQVLFTGPIAYCDALLIALPVSVAVFAVVWFVGKRMKSPVGNAAV